MNKSSLLCPLALCVIISCTSPIASEPGTEQNQDPDLVQVPPAREDDVQVSYTESTTHIVNPERGFYYPVDIRPSDNAISAASVKAQVAKGRTLFYLGFYLTDFMNGDISQSFLDKMQASFNALRQGGAKCILRYAYKDREKDKPWDATEEVVLRHVEQIKPLLQKNKDVIFVMQAGFVGVWGEWYYTTHFNYQPETDEDYLPRKRLMEALMDALPQERQIEVRTPQFKMRMYGLGLKDTLTAATAHNGSILSRLAGHNDCFGAAEDDYGTFDNETSDREFWKADTRYTIMGGETCNVSEYCTCTASLKDMQDYHWTYLNSGYNEDVIGRWDTQGCLEKITDRLGYRLVLKSVKHSASANEDGAVRVELTLDNAGFAAPMNPRTASLVFVASDGTVSKYPLGSDPRTWHPGKRVIISALKVDSGKGTVYLELSDPLLSDRPEYSIALANSGVYDSATGLNKLFEL